MAVKSVCDKADKKGPEYPKLMESTLTGAVFLITAPGSGTVIFGKGADYFSCTYDNWDMSHLEPFTGTITLSNE